MDIIEQIKKHFIATLNNLFSLNEQQQEAIHFELNIDPEKQQFGDITTNAAMVLAQQLKKNPRDIAQTILNSFSHQYVAKIEVAGPGFLNIYLTQPAFLDLIQHMIAKQADYFKRAPTTHKKNFNIEYVSANPTGPLHLGHGRGGIIGDVLSNIIQFIGHSVTREFYINDAGAQIEKLGRSFKARCQQVIGMNVSMPEDGYQGEYLLDLAKSYIAEQGAEAAHQPEATLAEYAKKKMLDQLQKTLASYGIKFDVWFSEKSLHTSGAVQRVFDILTQRGYLYEKDGALWFKSTEFGDDKDRVVRKSSGELTYVASDIAYMENKAERGFDTMILVLGHDHHSYGVRLEGLRRALGLNTTLHVILYQLIKMKASGELVRMSKRAGNIVTLQGVIDEVGADVARFFYLHRKADAQLDFDLDLALKKTDENPVYYVQYAYVRMNSILEKAQEEPQLANLSARDVVHLGEAEQFLIKKMAALRPLLDNISKNYQTHALTYYVIELANAFHSYYSKNRVIDLENIERSRARLVLIQQLKNTLGIALTLLGISKPEHM
jgi:arginyl-tRNA synthetase